MSGALNSLLQTAQGAFAANVQSRRRFMARMTAGAAFASCAGWSHAVRVQAEELKKQGKACILLWMQGGPSQFETFDPKPSHDHGGGIKAISTAASGVHIADRFPELAKQFKDIALIRSLTSKEGSHPRATMLMHTGYVPTASVKHPVLGSIAAKYLSEKKTDLPSFVRIGGRQANLGNAGFLGVEYDPFDLEKAGDTPRNAEVLVDAKRFRSRLALMEKLEKGGSHAAKTLVSDHRALYQTASRMVLSPQMDVFNLEKEGDKSKAMYGEGDFASGCLLARRLVEAGIPFVEVSLGNWDTHTDNEEQTKELSAKVDRPAAALLQDLKQRGLLDKTLVVWMGEFGRTPKINPRGGRDHFPKASNLWLAGCGIHGGQVIGATSADGSEVTERPLSVKDLFQSICKTLAIDANTENTAANGRPIKVVDEGEPIKELWG